MATRDTPISTDLSEAVVRLTKQHASPRESIGRLLHLLEVVVDFGTCSLSIVSAYFIYISLPIGSHMHYPIREVAEVSMVIGLLAVLLLENDRGNRGAGSLLHIRETERAIRVPLTLLLLVLPFSFALDLHFSRVAFCISLLLLPFMLLLEKQTFLSFLQWLHTHGYGVERVVVYGAGELGRRVVSALFAAPRLGLSPVGIIDDDPALLGTPVFALGYWKNRSIRVEQGPITPSVLRLYQSQLLIVAIRELSTARLASAVEAARKAGMRVASLAANAMHRQYRIDYIDIDGVLLTYLTDSAEVNTYNAAKRVLDIVGATLLVLILAPLLVIVACIICIESPGNAIFTQTRVGKNGRLFTMYKFRSMHCSEQRYDFSPTSSSDPRLTRVGRVLRHTSIDELPQLLNVIRGDMSLVGPRPEMPFIVAQYSDYQRQRLQVSPGITGLWQLSADRAFQIHENIEYDLYYIHHRTLFMDFAILLHTLFFAVRGI